MHHSLKRKIFRLTFLVLVVAMVGGGVLLIFQIKTKSVCHSTSSLTSLASVRAEKISQAKEQLQKSNLSERLLLHQLQVEKLCPAEETDWKNYLSSDSLSQLETKFQKILALINQSKNSLPSPVPTPKSNNPPSPTSPAPPFSLPTPAPNPTPPPSPNGPDTTPPTDQWEKKLAEFRRFYETEISPLLSELENKEEELINQNDYLKNVWRNYGLQEVWDELSTKDQIQYKELVQKLHQKVEIFLQKTKNYDSLKGVDLAGAKEEKLQNLPHLGPVSQLTGSDNSAVAPYKEWVQLKSTGDGNCFLNSFCILLTGQENKDLVLQLRLALFCETMGELSRICQKVDCFLGSVKLNICYNFQLKRICINYTPIISDYALYHLAKILKRNLLIICCSSVGIYTREALSPSPLYSETWVIYGNDIHAQPLIEKQK